MGFSSLLLPLATIAIAVGLPLLILIQLFRKRFIFEKVPSLAIWQRVLKEIAHAPKAKLQIFSVNFFIQFLMLILLALLSSSPVFFQKKQQRPTIRLLINRSTSMNVKSSELNSRWERVQKTVYNELIAKGLKPSDKIFLQFNPPLQSEVIETDLDKLSNILATEQPVDIAPEEAVFFRMEKLKGHLIYVSDSTEEIPESLKEEVSVLLIKDTEHINVGWINFWYEDGIVNGVVKNFSSYPLNINIDLKLNGISVPVNDLISAIKPQGTFLFQKNVEKEAKDLYLIEAKLTCPGDSLEADNTVAISRFSTQELRVLVAPDVPNTIHKAFSAINDKMKITIGSFDPEASSVEYDLYVGTKYIANAHVHQLIVRPNADTSLYRLSETNGVKEYGGGSLVDAQEAQAFQNILFEQVHELKEEVESSKLLFAKEGATPLILRWKILDKSVFLINFDCSENGMIAKLPVFPFLVAKILEELSLNRLLFYRTGDVLHYFDLPLHTPKVFQSVRRASYGKIDFQNEESVQFLHTGIYSNENVNLCVNLLDANESVVKQDDHMGRGLSQFDGFDMETPFDLKPYFFVGMILLLIMEFILFRKVQS